MVTLGTKKTRHLCSKVCKKRQTSPNNDHSGVSSRKGNINNIQNINPTQHVYSTIPNKCQKAHKNSKRSRMAHSILFKPKAGHIITPGNHNAITPNDGKNKPTQHIYSTMPNKCKSKIKTIQTTSNDNVINKLSTFQQIVTNMSQSQSPKPIESSLSTIKTKPSTQPPMDSHKMMTSKSEDFTLPPSHNNNAITNGNITPTQPIYSTEQWETNETIVYVSPTDIAIFGQQTNQHEVLTESQPHLPTYSESTSRTIHTEIKTEPTSDKPLMTTISNGNMTQLTSSSQNVITPKIANDVSTQYKYSTVSRELEKTSDNVIQFLSLGVRPKSQSTSHHLVTSNINIESKPISQHSVTTTIAYKSSITQPQPPSHTTTFNTGNISLLPSSIHSLRASPVKVTKSTLTSEKNLRDEDMSTSSSFSEEDKSTRSLKSTLVNNEEPNSIDLSKYCHNYIMVSFHQAHILSYYCSAYILSNMIVRFFIVCLFTCVLL